MTQPTQMVSANAGKIPAEQLAGGTNPGNKLGQQVSKIAAAAPGSQMEQVGGTIVGFGTDKPDASTLAMGGGGLGGAVGGRIGKAQTASGASVAGFGSALIDGKI